MFHFLVRESIQHCPAHNLASDCGFLMLFVGVWNAFVSQSLVTPASKQNFCASDIKPSAPAQLSLQTPCRCVSAALGTESINYQEITIMIMGDRVDIFYLLYEYWKIYDYTCVYLIILSKSLSLNTMVISFHNAYFLFCYSKNGTILHSSGNSSCEKCTGGLRHQIYRLRKLLRWWCFRGTNSRVIFFQQRNIEDLFWHLVHVLVTGYLLFYI